MAVSATALMLGMALSACATPRTEMATPSVAAWRPVDASTGQITDIAGLEALAEAFPDSGSVRLRLLNALLAADRTGEALTVASALAESGYSFSPAAFNLLNSLSSKMADSRASLGLNEANGTAIESSRLLATVPAEALLVESVWRDPDSGDLFVTTVVSRTLFVGRGGRWEEIPIGAAGSLTGIAYDPASGLLWIASGVVEQTPEPETAFSGLIAIDPRTGAVKRRVAGIQGSDPSDIAIDGAGRVYASDPLSGALYIAHPAAVELETLVAPGTLRSPQGIAVLPGGKHLAVSDYRYGLALVDAATGEVGRVTTDARILLDGFDGMWLHENRLIGVQNGTSPMRIVALHPDGGGAISAADNLEVAHSAWTEPLGGSISKGELVYVANGQWDRFEPGGAPVDGKPPLPTEIRALDLTARLFETPKNPG
jgi:DNA-binding beta-propeller fold protein YncE